MIVMWCYKYLSRISFDWWTTLSSTHKCKMHTRFWSFQSNGQSRKLDMIIGIIIHWSIVYQSVHPSFYLSIIPSIYPSIILSIYHPIYLSIHHSIYLSIIPSIILSIHHPSIHQSIYLSSHLSIHPLVFLISSYGHTIGPRSFLFGTAQFSLWASAQLVMIILSLTALTLC